MNHIETLEPEFAERVKLLLAGIKSLSGRDWVITSGRRTIAYQNELYAQGRTAPGKVVTNAKGGQSPHNFGLAADLAPLKNGNIWWNAPRQVWQQMADLAVEIGLTSGFYFKTIFDAPHVEDPNWKTVQAAWKRGEVKVA